MKTLSNGRKIAAEIPDCNIIVVAIYGKIGEKPVGSAVIGVHKSYAEVLHIYVDKPYRRQGYAQDLVNELKLRYKYIITGWSGSESCGKSLFLACGFEVKKSMFKNRHSTLEWRKKDAD